MNTDNIENYLENDKYLSEIGSYDLVYSFGVLHHTKSPQSN